MSEHDRKLIEQAKKLSYTDWSLAFDMAEKAVSKQAKNELENIGKRLYHTEEYRCGCL